MDYKEIEVNIKKSFSEKKNSHAFLFVTNNIEKCLNYTTNLICDINCRMNCTKEDRCSNCNLILTNNHPDYLYVEPDGTEIKVIQIKNVINLFTTKPSINPYSTYLIYNCDKLNESSSNKLLKFLEEPDGNIIGFYLTDNLEGVLSTIKSRCEIYNIKFETDNLLDFLNINEIEYDKYYNFAMKLIGDLNNSPKFLLMSNSESITKMERNDINSLLNLVKNMYVIKYRYLMENLDKDYLNPIINNIETNDIKIIVKRIRLLDNIINDFKINVNKELFINKLFLEWE